MNGFTHALRAKLDTPACLVNGINKGSCCVSLVDLPHPHVVIDLADPNLVAPIEIKDGAPNIAKATKQLQAGANAADGLTPRDLAIDFRPVLVSKELRRDKQFELRQASVRFRKREEKIRRVACGAPLTEALGSP